MTKKYLLLSALLCVSHLFAQNKLAVKVSELQGLKANFRPFSVLSVTQNTINQEVNKVVDGATLATLNTQQVNEIVTNQYGTIELEIPYQNQSIAILLYKVNPFAEGFHVDTDKGKNISYQKGVHYRGIIKGETNSVSSFNFFNGEFNGILSSSTLGNVVVGKLDKVNNQTDYIVYSDAKMKVLNGFDCHVEESGKSTQTDVEENRNVNSDRCTTFYFEIDNNLYVQNGSNSTTTTNWMTSVFNNVQTLFDNDGITVGLKSIFIWTEQDPYEGIGTVSSDYLYTFLDTRVVFDGDVGQLVGIDPGALGGVAFLNTLCTQNNYSYSDVNFSFSTVPTYSWTVLVISHEFGHSLGSPHTHGCYWNGNNTPIDGCGQQAGFFEPTQTSCPNIGPIPATDVKGTIMSYCHLISGVGISFSEGFGPQPSALILANVNSKTCLSFDCATSCSNTITELIILNETPTSISLTWSDAGTTTSWEVALTPFSSTNAQWNTVTTNSYTATGLEPNTYYRVRVRPLCAGGFEPSNRSTVAATKATNFCASVPFTDTGGTTGNYTDRESWVRTMTPNNPGLKLRATFSSFNLENNWDYLYIFDGADELAPILTPDGLTGTTNPGVFNSTASDGSLTFIFYSDQGTVASGWDATITCTGTLGIEDSNYLDFSYFPNPTKGTVSMSSNAQITEVKVYNVEGRLLFQQKKNDLTTSVDISQFSTGTYFFKVSFGELEKNFKVLKL
ncbi:M12 family metallo-peptidase [Flavobacterium sp.]|uniref:M12 family metallo-peptidase n=1 Tax=Flavobacterium sp. TaxID=239 RepID=UPI00391DA98B